MPKTYSDLLQEVKSSVRLVSLDDLNDRLVRGEPLTLVDVREKDEWRQGYIPGAVHLPRGFLEMQAESRLPDKSARLVVYCAGGVRSAFAARVLGEMGYESVESASQGYTQWKDKGFPIEVPVQLTAPQLERYSRHILLPEVGEKGQKKLLESKVLLLGAGGLGSPAALYLAAAGVGTLGIIDNDNVDSSNLQRQILHGEDRVGTPKVESAKKTLTNLNPDIEVVAVSRAPHERERRSHLRSRLGRDRRRARQLPDALPRERRVGLEEHPGRARIDLPLRRPGHDVLAEEGPVLPVPLPGAAAARTSRRAAPRRASSASCPGSSAPSRRPRRSRSCSARATRSSVGSSRTTASRCSSARSSSARTTTARSAARTRP